MIKHVKTIYIYIYTCIHDIFYLCNLVLSVELFLIPDQIKDSKQVDNTEQNKNIQKPQEDRCYAKQPQ